MTDKSPEIKRFIDELSYQIVGRHVRENECKTCGQQINKTLDFRDELSKREYEISGMCQKCQDSVYDVCDGG